MGSQSPSVYWRRRLVLLASVIALFVLVVLTIAVVSSGGSGKNAAGAPTSASTRPRPPATTSAGRSTATGSPTKSPKGSASGSVSGSVSGSDSASSTVAAKACAAAALKLSTATDATSYSLQAKPQLSLLVHNVGAVACVQNLGDRKIVLSVYNGESRVWGSHDCKIDPTPVVRTLAAAASVRLTIGWTGDASEPGQCLHRQHVGAGTYTLYGSLAGHQATAAQFTISP